MNSATQWVHDYKAGLEKGFLAIQQEAEEDLETLEGDTSEKAQEDRIFLKSIVTVTEAIMVFAARYSEEAARLAEQTENVTRKSELEEIANICARVPKYPAKTFREALQSQYFMQMFSRLEQKTGGTISNGRMDQYLYPYYKKDVAEGRITDADVKELLSCMWLGIAKFRDVYVSPAGGTFSNGYAHWEAVTIGGLTPDGYDATNELSYIFLENKRDLPLDYPDLAARIHTNTPERFLYEVAETIKQGTGHPKLLNDEEIIPVYLSKGATFAEANDYSVSGCTETRLVNRETWTSKGPAINLAALIELTLRNGRMKAYGDELLTIETGELKDFTTWEAFYEAFKKQESYYIQKTCQQLGVVHDVRERHFASPFGSSLHELCLKERKDLHAKEIEGGLDYAFFDMVGFASTVDSLSAIREVVYRKKYAALQDVVKAMDANFEGYEILKQRLIHVPCYGNNDEEVDAIAKEIDLLATQVAAEEANKISDKLIIDVRYVPVSANVAMGRVVSALPNGRLEGTALSDGTSAAHGADVNGPTAVLLSNYHTKNCAYRNRAARLLNLKFGTASVAGEAGTRRLVDFIKSWRDLKLWHIQFNIISQETLIDAQKHPENYRNLIVRVAGYSAYFVNLSEDLQDDIIRRTSHAAIA
jgi:formate C-acetyltransferase